MNIPVIGNYSGTVQVEMAHMRMDTSNVSDSEETKSLREAQPAQRRDEYIPSRIIVFHSNQYSVSDINRNRNDKMRSFQVGSILPGGEKVDEKVFDIILSGGMKNLQVYRKRKIINKEI